MALNRKKERGQWRKWRALLQHINEMTPFTSTDDRYEHFHVPSDPFLQHSKTSGKIKTAFCKSWLAATETFLLQKPENLPFCKVVALLKVPNLWESQIIIFYCPAYYNAFWDRKDAGQTWEPLEDGAPSFAAARNLQTALRERGYIETICNADGTCSRFTLWFYGE